MYSGMPTLRTAAQQLDSLPGTKNADMRQALPQLSVFFGVWCINSALLFPRACV